MSDKPLGPLSRITMGDEDYLDEAEALARVLYDTISRSQTPDNEGLSISLNALAGVCGVVLARARNNHLAFSTFSAAVWETMCERLKEVEE